MRAVNLVPADERRGAGGAGGRSGGAAYFLLGALVLALVMVTAYVLAGRSVTENRTELAEVTRQADAAEASARTLAPFTDFASLREKRVATVASLAASRFDWSHALHEVARTIPKNAWLTSLKGTVAPGVSVEGGTDDPLRSAISSPAVEIIGCTTNQANVARMMAAMRLVDGVQRVSLSASEKSEEASAASSGDSDGDCRQGNARWPQFSLTVFFATGASR